MIFFDTQKLSNINELKKKVKKIELCTLRMHTKSCSLNVHYYYMLCLSTGCFNNKNSKNKNLIKEKQHFIEIFFLN